MADTATLFLRCVVCGKEREMHRDVAYRAMRTSTTGELKHGTRRFSIRTPDGVEVGACSDHTADEVRAAWVLTERTLTVTLLDQEEP